MKHAKKPNQTQSNDSSKAIVYVIALIFTLLFFLVFVWGISELVSATEKTREIPTSSTLISKDFGRMEVTESSKITLSKFLTYNDVETTVEDIDSFGRQAIDGDPIYGLLTKAVSGHPDKILLRLTGQHLRGLPHNTLIHLPDKLLILDHATSSSVFFWGDEVSTVIIKSYSDFEREYRTKNGKAYIIIDRGYDLK